MLFEIFAVWRLIFAFSGFTSFSRDFLRAKGFELCRVDTTALDMQWGSAHRDARSQLLRIEGAVGDESAVPFGWRSYPWGN